MVTVIAVDVFLFIYLFRALDEETLTKSTANSAVFFTRSEKEQKPN